MRAALRAFAILLALLGVAQAQQPGRRVALVIGNGGYANVPALPNAVRDAALIADTLRGLGFELVGGGAQSDLDRPRLAAAVQSFGRALAGAEAGLFYYAGHGLQVGGVNWLVPVDANPARTQDLDFQMVDADLVLRQMDGAGTRLNMVLLDACRNNPFARTGMRSAQSGLAEMRAPEGTLISYATQPGAVAMDGPVGGNGPYASALSQAMLAPDADIFRLFNQVGLIVKRGTSGAQQPWVSSSPIDGDFRFASAGAAGVGLPALPAPAPGPVPVPSGPGPAAPDPFEAMRAAAIVQRCSILDVQREGAAIRVTGFGPIGLDTALRGVGATRGVRVAHWGVATLPPFACDSVEALAPAIRRATAPLLPARRIVASGAPLTLDLPPGRAIRVDVYQADTVRHIEVPPGASSVTLPRLAFAGAAIGERLLAIIASREPLLERRPMIEPASAYLAALGPAMEAARAEAAIALVMPSATPVGTQASGTSRAGGSRSSPACAAVLERAQLGEALSDADRAALRGCR